MKYDSNHSTLADLVSAIASSRKVSLPRVKESRS